MYRKFGFFGGNLRSDPPKPGGDFENPEGNPPGPTTVAEAGERSEATNGGRSGAPRAPRPNPANLKSIAKNKKKYQNKVRNTQPNPHYSAKNNVAIRMIYTFMPKRFL